MFKVTFTQIDVNNLAAFLERITLKGNEVSAFNNIINALNSAEKVNPPLDKKKVDKLVDEAVDAIKESL
jgi:hypothetical protein